MELFQKNSLFGVLLMIIRDRFVLVNTLYFVILMKLDVDMCTIIILYVSLLHMAVLAGI